jgi:hypothetical protein
MGHPRSVSLLGIGLFVCAVVVAAAWGGLTAYETRHVASLGGAAVPVQAVAWSGLARAGTSKGGAPFLEWRPVLHAPGGGPLSHVRRLSVRFTVRDAGAAGRMIVYLLDGERVLRRTVPRTAGPHEIVISSERPIALKSGEVRILVVASPGAADETSSLPAGIALDRVMALRALPVPPAMTGRPATVMAQSTLPYGMDMRWRHHGAFVVLIWVLLSLVLVIGLLRQHQLLRSLERGDL